MEQIRQEELKSFVKQHYSDCSDIICTEKIAEVLTLSIQKMIDIHQMENSREAIEEVLRKDSTRDFVKSRQPNVSNIPLEVIHDVKCYFEQPGGVNNFVPMQICRASNDPGDDYLYAVIGYNQKTQEYACWTAWNQSTGSLNFGHYNLPNWRSAFEIVKNRFNDISNETDKFGIENTLTGINEPKTAEMISLKMAQDQAEKNIHVSRKGR